MSREEVEASVALIDTRLNTTIPGIGLTLTVGAATDLVV